MFIYRFYSQNKIQFIVFLHISLSLFTYFYLPHQIHVIRPTKHLIWHPFDKKKLWPNYQTPWATPLTERLYKNQGTARNQSLSNYKVYKPQNFGFVYRHSSLFSTRDWHKTSEERIVSRSKNKCKKIKPLVKHRAELFADSCHIYTWPYIYIVPQPIADAIYIYMHFCGF